MEYFYNEQFPIFHSKKLSSIDLLQMQNKEQRVFRSEQRWKKIIDQSFSPLVSLIKSKIIIFEFTYYRGYLYNRKKFPIQR